MKYYVKQQLRKSINILLAVLLVIPLFATVAPQQASAISPFAGGSGTEQDPYLIETAGQLNEVRNYLDKHFKQIKDIDLSSYNNWLPIGNDSNRFIGSFDGAGYIISNLTINQGNNAALFAYTGSSAELKNVGIENVNSQGSNYVGSLVAHNYGIIANSYSTGVVKGVNDTGGLVTYNHGTITNAYHSGEVTGTNTVGGLVGHNLGTITNTYSTGKVVGTNSVGGLVGINSSWDWPSQNIPDPSDYATITNSYTTGEVTGVNSDSFCYDNFFGTITNSSVKTKAEMKQKETFENWDFGTIWYIEEGISYPTFLWLIDDTSPELNMEITGTKGNNDWYTTEATFKLTATDNLSGVKEIQYR
ncbi:hypothetical protein CIB95_11325, partial [Lottiidibacillus patelloidae]